MRALSRPVAWHYVSLVAGLAFILPLQRGQWFFFDEWAFIQINGPGMFEPHVGHWSTSPHLVYDALGSTVGLHSYMPYAVLVTLLHIAIAHLVWRIAIRSGAAPWIATTSVAVLVFLGAGAENILWAFQIGFLGGLALGLLALWLSTAERVSRCRLAWITGIAVFSLTWSGTAIPLVVATSFVLWRRQGWRKTVFFATFNAAVFLAWYLAFAAGSTGNPDTGGFGLHKMLIDIPLFLGVMFILGFGKLFPLVEIGALVLVVAVIWLIKLFTKKASTPELLPALALTLAVVVFALLSAFSRASLSIGAGRSSRYVYTLVALLLPILTIALSRLASRWSAGVLVASLALLALAGYQAALLVRTAGEQSLIEQGSRAQLSAALQLYEEDPDAVSLGAIPDATWAPDLSMADLIDLYESGRIDIGEYTDADMRRAEQSLGLGN